MSYKVKNMFNQTLTLSDGKVFPSGNEKVMDKIDSRDRSFAARGWILIEEVQETSVESDRVPVEAKVESVKTETKGKK
jgi:hypothetical protein